jgi:hypothetical protein
MRILNNLTGLLFGFAIGVMLFLAMIPAHADEALPREKPATATGFFCKGNTATSIIVVAIVITYPSGKVVRIDTDHMYGLDANSAIKYASAADDQKVYQVNCSAQIST